MTEWVNRVHTGDAFDVLDDLPDASIHACVTDPPYGLAFMGRDWDDFEPKEYQEWCEEWSTAAKRVLKPGAHLLAFSGNRTHHRLFAGVEDAGFEIRDTITWHYGSGFPKSKDVGKLIDKREGEYENREKVGERDIPPDLPQQSPRNTNTVTKTNSGADKYEREGGLDITKPATETAEKWDGWKTLLKPATEFLAVARKPFDGAAVDCVLEHGTGALNIDGCRVGTDPTGGHWPGGDDKIGDENLYSNGRSGGEHNPDGRYPANVVFDEAAAADLDDEVGETSGSTVSEMPKKATNGNDYGEYDTDETGVYGFDDSGGPSRYFYTSKASKSDRTLDGQVPNDHPTVKPTDLMEWLVRLVTREDQVVLDPFAGSGTTLLAAKQQARQFVGIEKQPKYADVARARIGIDVRDPSHVTEDDAQASALDYL